MCGLGLRCPNRVFCVPAFSRSVWWWCLVVAGCVFMLCRWLGCDVLWCDVVGCEMRWSNAVGCEVRWSNVVGCEVSCHVMCCHVMWCDVKWCDSMRLCDVMNWKMMCCELPRAHVTVPRLHTTKYYSVLQSITPCYKVLLPTAKYWKVLQNITPYYKAVLRTRKYYSVLQSTTTYYTVLRQSITPYYKGIFTPRTSCQLHQILAVTARPKQVTA